MTVVTTATVTITITQAEIATPMIALTGNEETSDLLLLLLKSEILTTSIKLMITSAEFKSIGSSIKDSIKSK